MLSLVGLDETLSCDGYFYSNVYGKKVLDEDRASLNPVGGDTNHPSYSQQHQQQRQQQRALIAMAGVPPGVRMLPPRREARGLPRVLDDQLYPIDRDTPGNSSSNDPYVSFLSWKAFDVCGRGEMRGRVVNSSSIGTLVWFIA